MILVSEADIFSSESLHILAERFISVIDYTLTLRYISYYSPLIEVGVFSTEIKKDARISPDIESL